MTKSYSKLFETFRLMSGLTLRNQAVMAPMTTWAGNDDGTVSEDEINYYRCRVKGVGLVITGCTHVQANGIGFTGEFAAYDDGFLPSLRNLAEAAKSGGAPAILQIFHAGNKAVPHLTPDNEVVSASAVNAPIGPFNKGDLVARALSNAEILEVIAAFGDATRRAIEAGFDGIELHGAHGFLIQNFFSPHFNQRTDSWGGSPENRMRFPLAVVGEVKRVIAAHAKRPFALGYRISPEEPEADGLRLETALNLVDELVKSGVDYLHVSLGDLNNQRPMGHRNGKTIAQLISERLGGRIPMIAAGHVRTPAQACAALEAGVSLVAIGQALVMNPDWVGQAAAGSDDQITVTLAPSDVATLRIPSKLWAVIEATKGWFAIRELASGNKITSLIPALRV